MKMKKLLLCTLLVLPLVAPAVVFAAENEAGDKLELSSELAAEEKKAFDKRVAERKAKAGAKLSLAQQNIVRARCPAAAAIVSGVQTQVTAFESKRPDLYNKLTATLETLSPKLTAAGIDATAYDKQVAELKTKTKAFDQEAAALKAAVDDLAEIDCDADPEAFVITIRESVALRQSIIKHGREIRSYLKDSLRPTLSQVRADLQSTSKESEQ